MRTLPLSCYNVIIRTLPNWAMTVLFPVELQQELPLLSALSCPESIFFKKKFWKPFSSDTNKSLCYQDG